MPEGYRHLTFDERCQIYALRKSGLSNGAIARQLGRHPATISREIRRNGGGRGYRQGQAWRKATERRSEASSVPGKLTEERWAKVVAKLEEGWSPEQVSGRLRLEDPGMVGRQRIYDLVRADHRDGGTLFGHLRRRGKEPDRQGGRHAGRGHIPGRRDISERPKEVGAKARIGDWEADTVIGGGHSGAVVSLVDRCSKFTLLQRVDGKKAEAVGEAMTDLLKGLGARVHTITADNGKEFAGHAKVAKALEADFFLPTPYHSWERGLNEHTNGLLRQYLPKGTDLRQVTDARVKRVQDILNARPRKALGYLTPAEAFARARPP